MDGRRPAIPRGYDSRVKPLAITLGDPAGIGPEIVAKALAAVDVPHRVFGAVPENVRYGQIAAEYGRVALDAIDAAVGAIERGECSALVTAPIHKQAIALAGSPHPGHTELLAARAGLNEYGRDYAMYFDSPRLRTVLLSVHVPLTEAIRTIDAERIASLARLMTRDYERLYGERPRIAVAGVNPHAGEGGRFGDEEETIARGVALARNGGLEVSGPHPPDTVFLAATRGKYDVVMAMYHDQGLIPVKTLAFEQSVNVTIGLPWLRVSVDHGTAFDIAGRGIADAAPMRYAIEWAASHAERFAR
jgi:4-hydroxythreonine-4-phosphate dehydrogenase